MSSKEKKATLGVWNGKKIRSWSEEKEDRMRFQRRFNFVIFKMIPTLMLFTILATLIAYPIAYAMSVDESNVTVTKVERVNDEYLVFGENETFEITDTILFNRWDGSDLYGSIEIGKTYTVETAGWRIPFFSMYRNILTTEEVTDEK